MFPILLSKNYITNFIQFKLNLLNSYKNKPQRFHFLLKCCKFIFSVTSVKLIHFQSGKSAEVFVFICIFSQYLRNSLLPIFR